LETASAAAREIRARIFETRLTASADISYDKFLAKLASTHGQLVITPDKALDYIASLPVGKFHGSGLSPRLGLAQDLRAQSLAFLQQHFGKSAAWYLGICEWRGRPAGHRRSAAQMSRFGDHLRSRSGRA